MGILSTAIGAAKTPINNQIDLIGRPSFAIQNPYSLLNQCGTDEFASTYPNISAISKEFMTIRPYAVDKNGKQVKAPALNALYHPNQIDSSVAFFEKLAVSTLFHRKTYILVWRREGNEAKPGGEITPENIAGYTFLEYPSINQRDGRTYYSKGTNEYTEDEVMVIPGGVDPKNLYGGYSPSTAAKQWATLDDYIADYQAGFFQNGAVPAGQFVVTAPTAQEYEDIVDMLQKKHRGAGKNNNITYSHKPIDPNTGKPADAQIEWIPFGQTNKDIDFKNVFEQTNKRLDTSFGVSQQVKGVDDSATYANAQVSEAAFAKRAVKPLALRIYTQITHELNRITNGLGVSITFNYEIPAVADEELVRANTKTKEVTAIKELTALGYSLDSIVDALQLDPYYKKLSASVTTPAAENDETDVDEGGEVNSAPDTKKLTKNKKKTDNKKLTVVEKPKAELSDLEKLKAAATRYMEAQIDRSIKEYGEDQAKAEVNPDPTKDEKQTFVNEMLVVVVSIMIAQGEVEYGVGKTMLIEAGLSTENLNSFVLSDTAKSNYEAYLAKVGESYGKDTAEAIRATLLQADNNGLTRKETEAALKNILDTDQWRIERLSTTELNRSQSLSGIESMKQIQAESGAVIEKSLQHTGGDGPCEFCAALIDAWIAVDQDTIPKDTILIGVDGGLLVNKFAANEGYDPHPNGHCIPQFRINSSGVASNGLGAKLSTKASLRCRDCDRFLRIEPLDTTITKVTCNDRKCKQVNNVKVIFPGASEHQTKYKFPENESAKAVETIDKTKEDKKILEAKLKDAETYIANLESIVDGQG